MTDEYLKALAQTLAHEAKDAIDETGEKTNWTDIQRLAYCSKPISMRSTSKPTPPPDLPSDGGTRKCKKISLHRYYSLT